MPKVEKQSIKSMVSIDVGDVMSPLTIPIDATVIVTGAIASQDLYPGHHDRDFAISAGMKDVFMNILTTNGIVGRFITDWAGPNASLLGLSIQLGVPNFPGDEMTLTGEVTEIEREVNVVTVSFTGSNSLGTHVSGDATVRFEEES